MKIIGYGAAWPSFELKDFNNWKTNMGLFLDIAGDEMDAISYHLYDGVNQTGQNNKRSGSNNEAIMDLIETYSFSRWGFIKPHAITEYGGIAKNEFSLIQNMQSIRSQNAMIFGLLDREDRLEISILLLLIMQLGILQNKIIICLTKQYYGEPRTWGSQRVKLLDGYSLIEFIFINYGKN